MNLKFEAQRQTSLKIPAMDLLVSLTAGPQVLKNAHKSEITTTSINWPQGKNAGTFDFT